MDEFVSRIQQRAAEVLRRTVQQEAMPGTDPLLELIGVLLEDAAGSDLPPADSSMTAEQWLTWTELVLTRQTELVQAMTSVLERERTELPREMEAMRAWAAWLVLSTLDQMEML